MVAEPVVDEDSLSQDVDMPSGTVDAAPTDVLALTDGPSMNSSSIKNDTDMFALTDATSPLKGTIGLTNIGNTCFMNSVLQCLFHCRLLCEYFVSGRYKSEINTTNVLGTGGKLVTQFANLLDRIWVNVSSYDRSITPRELKYVIGEHAPMFVGYHQHDSQELLTFLLDGLHEDLNLVINKPYTETVEGGDGRPDIETARIAWDRHLLRNKSVIVDLFQGQFKSRLRCPHCCKSSVTFDPFMYLSVPIPSSPDLTVMATFSYAARQIPPMRLAVNVFRETTDIVKAIAAAVVSELPEGTTQHDPSEDIVIDDVLVFTLSPSTNSYILSSRNNQYSSGRLSEFEFGKYKKVFCTYARRGNGPVLSAPHPPSSSVLCPSPSAESLLSPSEPTAKRMHREDALDRMGRIVIQTRIGPRSSFGINNIDSCLPSKNRSVLGPPTAICLSEEEISSIEKLISLLKRTVLYSVGTKSKEVLEGLKSNKFGLYLVDPARGGSIYCESFLSSGEALSDLGQKFLEKTAALLTETGLVSLVVDIPIDDSLCVSGGDASEPDQNYQTWDDVLYSIEQRVGDYFQTEKSWKLAAVGGGTNSRSSIRSQSNSIVSLSDCFKLFSAEEVLGESDRWYCSNCKTHVQASKKIDIWKLPQILIIHLKRFQYARGYRNKIESVVDFPVEQELDMAAFLESGAGGSSKYKLFAISNHTGSLYSGHYTAYAKCWGEDSMKIHENEWYSFNDSYVSALGGSPACDSSNYLLFYERSN